MAPVLTEDMGTVLQSLLDLYGAGRPEVSAATSGAHTVAAVADGHRGNAADGYSNFRAMQATIADSHAEKDDLVFKAVGVARDGTVTGRNHLTNQIADFQARVQAIAAVGSTRFSGPALLDAAHQTITSAAQQVGADVAAARRQAARISPPLAVQPVAARASSSGRRRRRTRPSARAGRVTRHRLPSDASAGGRAVGAANSWVGAPYQWGGGGANGPSGGGFDCSGLTQYAIAQATHGRVVLPRTTYEQIYSGVRIPAHDVRPGDLVFPASSFSSRGPEHVQLAAGNGMVIEAPHAGSTVQWSRMPSHAVVVRVL
ncbi:C40 family peptidase [Nocardia vaccinii]|uniref:C40 family peptidase n=1 Tax=Nocardia vaccinii TaxID=1822 RepID=UPI0008301977|nr:NlpC/P60 family protein [Nocardia vaccinii]